MLTAFLGVDASKAEGNSAGIGKGAARAKQRVGLVLDGGVFLDAAISWRTGFGCMIDSI